jgi:hypothetical protein
MTLEEKYRRLQEAAKRFRHSDDGDSAHIFLESRGWKLADNTWNVPKWQAPETYNRKINLYVTSWALAIELDHTLAEE